MNKKYLVAVGIFLGVGIALFVLLAFFVAPRVNYASTPVPTDLDAATLVVAKGLYCPVCPGVPLDVCDTQACQQWRALIREKLGEGQTAAQIETYFVEQYGERVLGAPRAQGWNLIVYALPAFALSGGAALLYLFVQRRTRNASPSPQSPVSDAYRSRIENELQENE